MPSEYTFEEYVQQLQALQAAGWNCTPRDLWSMVVEMQSLAINVRDNNPDLVAARDLLEDAYAVLTARHRDGESMAVPANLSIVKRTADNFRDRIDHPVLTLGENRRTTAHVSL